MARCLKSLAALLVLSLCVVAPRRAGAQGTIQGRVTASDGEPLQQARVLLVGTELSAVTAQDGRYVLRNVPTGPQTVRVLRVGYREGRKATTVGVNATVGMDFTLERTVVQLEEMVSTATGSRPREELGNSIASINATAVTGNSVVNNIQDVLAARVPGVSVQGGQQTGSGGRVRIRGNSSLNLSNDPIYVIDGIRMTSNTNSSNLFTGGSQPVRVNDINPEEIENIEIVKGPSAATLYGTDAANGVVVITTKKGRAGNLRWNTYAEGGILKDRSDYPYNYTIAGHSPGSTTYRECTLSVIASGACVMDSVRIYSPLHDVDVTPVSTGWRDQAGISAQGGNDAVRFYLAGEKEEETAALGLPEFEKRRLAQQSIVIRDYTRRPNALAKYSSRANLNATPMPSLDLAISSGLTVSNTRFVTESNATVGLGSQIFGGKGYKESGNVTGLEAGTPTTPLLAYRAWTPGYAFQELNRQRLTRVIASGRADWRPYAWMQNRATLGMDFTGRQDVNLNRRGGGPPINSTYRLGFAEDSRTNIRNLTFELGSTATWRPLEWMAARSTLGTQYVNYYLESNDALGSRIAPGTQTPNSGSIPSVATGTTVTKTVGAFVEEQVAMHDRLFVTGALRSDQNSAFGTKFQQVLYPKLSVSWIASNESYFPQVGWLDQLRLRAAYGKSGVQPGANDALRTFSGIVTNYRASDLPGDTYNAVGNEILKPERTGEIEAGFDLRLLGRANAELTFYNKNTKDALIDFIIAPSAGAATDVRRNLGAVQNRGFEALLSGTVIDRGFIAFDLTLSYAANDNKLLRMGKDATGKDLPPIVGTNTRAQPGFPLFGLWAQPILGWEDKDGNGIITYDTSATLNEVFIGKDTIFRGYSSPRYTGALLPGVDLFNKRLRIASLFEYKGGNLYYNNTERIRCASRNNCNGLMNPKASFQEQAMAVAHLVHPSTTLDGFYQPGSFVRWRELNVTYQIPNTFAARYMRSRQGFVNFAARNLQLWTDYRGLDPEIDFQSGVSNNGAPQEFQSMGTPTYYIVRLNLVL